MIELLNFLGIFTPVIFLSRDRITRRNKIDLLFIGLLILIFTVQLNIFRVFFVTYIFAVSLYLLMFDISDSEVFISLICSSINLLLIYITNIMALKIICNLNIIESLNQFDFKFMLTMECIILNFLMMIYGKEIINMIKIKGRPRLINRKLIVVISSIFIAVIILIKYNPIKLGYLFFFAINFTSIGLLLCYLATVSIRKNYIINKKQSKIEVLEEYIILIENINKDVRRFQHDYVNILSTMSEYFNNDNYDKLKSYFRENILSIEDEIESNDLRLGLLSNIKVYDLKGVLLHKIIKAKEKGVKIFIDISDKIDNININPIDLARIIGIIMDNAIEAASESEERIILIGMFIKGDGVNFICENSFSNKNLNLHQILTEGFTTKGGNRGIGLTILRNILSKYDNSIMDTMIDKNRFVQHIIIY